MSLYNLVILGQTVFEIFEELVSCRMDEHDEAYPKFPIEQGVSPKKAFISVRVARILLQALYPTIGVLLVLVVLSYRCLLSTIEPLDLPAVSSWSEDEDNIDDFEAWFCFERYLTARPYATLCRMPKPCLILCSH